MKKNIIRTLREGDGNEDGDPCTISYTNESKENGADPGSFSDHTALQPNFTQRNSMHPHQQPDNQDAILRIQPEISILRTEVCK